MPAPIIKSKILLVEGKDEVYVFGELLSDLNLYDGIQLIDMGGKDQFEDRIQELVNTRSGFENIKSIGIVRDADNHPKATFDSICSVLKKVKLPKPKAPLQPAEGPPKVAIMIIPDEHSKGMLENVCLDSVSDDPAMVCVDEFFDCLKANHPVLSENVIPKARVRAFLASREWLEIAHFEYLQKCMENYEPVIPESPAIAVPKAHLFLASRFTPDLSLGIAAQKSDDRYWNFNHPAFEKIKQFLRML